MTQVVRTPMITTRGFYNLQTASLTHKNNFKYKLTPKNKLEKILGEKEITIFIHGMRNTNKGAIMGTRALTRKLRKLGYKHPIISYSYDANISGTGSRNKLVFADATIKATFIARSNGFINLRAFIDDLKLNNPKCKINIIAHSMGCVVVEGLIDSLLLFKTSLTDKKIIHKLHLFGSPISTQSVKFIARSKLVGKVVNHYNPNDQVILGGMKDFGLVKPSCIIKPIDRKVTNKNAFAKDHRFKSYVKIMRSIP